MDREGVAVTTTEIESYLAKHYPDHQFTVSDKLGIGLAMADGVMLYCRVDGPQPLDSIAKQLIAMTKGKRL